MPKTPVLTVDPVDENIARNCTTISPCQQDATIIRDAEIDANIVNECGRTELTGNIDVGENTENALAAGKVTKVKAGTELTVTIHQVNADGAGPYVCDLDETSNSGIISQNLTVTNNVPGVNGLSQAKAQAFNITVKMPDNLSCTGGKSLLAPPCFPMLSRLVANSRSQLPLATSAPFAAGTMPSLAHSVSLTKAVP